MEIDWRKVGSMEALLEMVCEACENLDSKDRVTKQRAEDKLKDVSKLYTKLKGE